MTDPRSKYITLHDAQYLPDAVARLTRELAAARRESANRLAAIRAALRAAADGEDDPLEYLRMEIGDYPPEDRGRP